MDLSSRAFRTNWAPWIITLVASAGLLGLGYLSGRQSLEPQVQHWQKRAAEEATRANQLAALNQSLETRLSKPAAPAPPQPDSFGPKKPLPEGQTRVLSKGRAALMLEGRVIITLLDISHKPRRAALKISLPGGREGKVILGPGSSTGVRIGGKVYHLVLTAIHTSSISFALIP